MQKIFKEIYTQTGKLIIFKQILIDNLVNLIVTSQALYEIIIILFLVSIRQA